MVKTICGLLRSIDFYIECHEKEVKDDFSGESLIVTVRKTLHGLLNDIIHNKNVSDENQTILDRCVDTLAMNYGIY